MNFSQLDNQQKEYLVILLQYFPEARTMETVDKEFLEKVWARTAKGQVEGRYSKRIPWQNWIAEQCTVSKGKYYLPLPTEQEMQEFLDTPVVNKSIKPRDEAARAEMEATKKDQDELDALLASIDDDTEQSYFTIVRDAGVKI